MLNMTVQNNRTNGVILWDPTYNDGTATFSVAETWPAGAVLGKLTATGKYVRFTPGAGDGSQTPIALLSQAVTSVGAGDVRIRPMISGKVRASDLTNNAGGALTAPQHDQLRDYTIIALATTQLSQLDNQ